MNIVNKIIRYTNNKILRTPGLEFIQKNPDEIKRRKHINFWINRASKIKSFQKYFFEQGVSDKRDNLNVRFKNTPDYMISENMFDALATNGLVVIEDALPKDEWISVLSHFNDLKSKSKSKSKSEFEKNWNSKPKNPNFFSKTNEIAAAIDISEFPYLNKYSEIASNEIYGKTVNPTVEFHYLNLTEDLEDKTRGATYLHTDRFLPHFKIFYTPTLIDEDSGPFQYSLGSHKINENYIDYFIKGKNYDETDEYSKPLINQTETITAKENTLYLAFTNGMHKRTVFKKKDKERSMVFLQYIKNFNKFNYLFR